MSCYMGREAAWWLIEADRSKVDKSEHPDIDRPGFNPRKPWESVADGCPGGWYRTEFTASMQKYRRRMTESGGHDHNPLIHADTNPRVLEALQYLEACEAAARAEYYKILDAKRKA